MIKINNTLLYLIGESIFGIDDDDLSDMGDYEKYDNRIKEKTRLLWPGYDIEICEYLYD